MAYGARVLALVASATALVTGCSDQVARPTAPSPGAPQATSEPPLPPAPSNEGPGITAPGIRLTAAPRSDGTFDVTEEVTLREAVPVVQLRPPVSGERLQGMMSATTPRVVGLEVVADGEQFLTNETEVHRARDLALGRSATRLTLTYRLTDSTVRRSPSRPGRALAAISPLTAPTDGTLPTNLAVTGGGLLNAVCPLLRETRCAVGEPPGLGIQQGIPAARALVVLQLDLPIRR